EFRRFKLTPPIGSPSEDCGIISASPRLTGTGMRESEPAKEVTTMAVTATRIESINPATEEVLKSFDEFTPQQVDQSLAEANAARCLADEHIQTSAKDSYVAYEPLGVVLAIMPWNFPFWQVMRFAAPALMAGNAAVLKHASNVPQCALAIEQMFREAGFPKGLLRTVLVSGSAIEPIIADDRIRAVTLTGSSDTGSRIAELAGRALKKTV